MSTTRKIFLNLAQIIPDAVGSVELTPDAVGSVELTPDVAGSAELTPDVAGSVELTPDVVGSKLTAKLTHQQKPPTENKSTKRKFADDDAESKKHPRKDEISVTKVWYEELLELVKVATMGSRTIDYATNLRKLNTFYQQQEIKEAPSLYLPPVQRDKEESNAAYRKKAYENSTERRAHLLQHLRAIGAALNLEIKERTSASRRKDPFDLLQNNIINAINQPGKIKVRVNKAWCIKLLELVKVITSGRIKYSNETDALMLFARNQNIHDFPVLTLVPVTEAEQHKLNETNRRSRKAYIYQCMNYIATKLIDNFWVDPRFSFSRSAASVFAARGAAAAAGGGGGRAAAAAAAATPEAEAPYSP